MRTSWDYRVVRRLHDGEADYRIHEIYYEGDAITMWSQEAIAPSGYNLKDLIADLDLMAAATYKPVLELADLPGHPEGESDS